MALGRKISLLFLVIMGSVNYTSAGCLAEGDIVFLVDESGSVGSNNFDKIKDFISLLVSSFPVGVSATQFSFATFTNMDVKDHIKLSDYHDENALKLAIAAIPYRGGGENIPMALEHARTHLFTTAYGMRDSAFHILVMITDGRSGGWNASANQAQVLKNKGVVIFTVGIGNGINEDELKAVASDPALYRHVTDFGILNDIREQLTKDVCEDNVQQCTTNHCLNGGECISVGGANLCRCQNYYGGNICQDDLCFPLATDSMILMDVSLSTDDESLTDQKNFVTTLIQKLPIAIDKFQISLVTYSDSAVVEIPFDATYSKQNIVDRLASVSLRNKSTNIAEALRYTRSLLSGRSSTRQFVYLLMDGLPSNYVASIEQAKLLRESLERNFLWNRLYTVAFGKSVRQQTFIDMTSQGGGYTGDVFSIHNMDVLYATLPRVVNLVCDVCKEESASDILLLIDNHGNISVDIYNKQLDMVGDIFEYIKGSNHLQLSDTALQIGLVAFSDNVEMSVGLNITYNIDSISKTAQTLLQSDTSSERNVTTALTHAQRLLYGVGKGARPSARKFLFYFVTHDVDHREFQTLKQKGTTIVTIATHDHLDDDNLCQVASTSFHAYGAYGNGADLDDKMLELMLRDLRYINCFQRII